MEDQRATSSNYLYEPSPTLMGLGARRRRGREMNLCFLWLILLTYPHLNWTSVHLNTNHKRSLLTGVGGQSGNFQALKETMVLGQEQLGQIQTLF